MYSGAHCQSPDEERADESVERADGLADLSFPLSPKISVPSVNDPSYIDEEHAINARVSGATIVVADLDYQWGSRSKSTTYDLKYYLKEVVSWPKAEVIFVHQSDCSSTAAHRLIRALREAKRLADAQSDAKRPATYSGSFAIETYGGTFDNHLQRMGKITEAEITDIVEIINITRSKITKSFPWNVFHEPAQDAFITSEEHEDPKGWDGMSQAEGSAPGRVSLNLCMLVQSVYI